MIAKNLLVHGSSRFLNTAYFQDVSISGTATLSSLSLSGNLSVTGTSTLSGHVSVGGYNNTSYGLSANSAIINNWIRTVGSTGWYNESHGGGWYMKDNDYIRSYNKPVLMDHNIYFGTAGDSGYYVKTTGAAKFASVAAPTATISTVNTTNLSVSNNLRAAHFDLQTVAQLGGSFYVSPTVKFPNSGTTLTVAKSGSTLTLTITDSSITSTTMAGIVWSANSHVKVSGTINGVVTGTMDGTVSSINTSSHVLTLSVSGENSASVVAGTYSASQFSNLTVMIYQRRDGSNDYRVGIWMNCYDVVNSSSTIRIYGGSDTNPNVMLGNLTSAGLGTVNNLTPTGWGLFAQNAFLHGKVVANGGLIGNWTIGESSMYYSSDAPSNSSIVLAPGGKTASVSIGGSGTAQKSWVFTVKNLFGVDTSGALYSSSGKIGGWNIGTSSLYNTTNSMTSTGVGLYLGTDGIRNYASGTQYVNITSGKITALGVDVSGKITATSGAIGGFDITSTAIKTKDVAVTSNADNSISLSSADFTRTINSTSRAGLRFAIGDKFGVTGDGTIYANSANISGTLTAGANSKIGPWNVTATSIYKVSNTLGSGTSGAAYFGNDGLSVGNKFKVDATGVATLGLSSGYHATMDTDSFDVLNGSTTLATFGETAVIGNMSARGVSIDSNGFKFNNNGEQNFFIGIDNRQTQQVTSAFDTITNDSIYTLKNNIQYIQVAPIPSDATIISVQGYLEYAKDSSGEEWWSDQEYGDVSSWILSSGYLWVEDEYSQFVEFEARISFSFSQNRNSNLPYMIFGTNVYEEHDIPGIMSFVQGDENKALGSFSTACGSASVASGNSAFARGINAIASGYCSYSSGCGTVALESYNTVIGRYNKAYIGSDDNGSKVYYGTGDYPFIIGNGTADTDAGRSNALTVDWAGNVQTAGKVMAANTSYVGMIIMSTTLKTMAKVIEVYGGTTWVEHRGYFLIGNTSVVTPGRLAADGGEYRHTLTEAEMPSHTHTTNAAYAYYGNGGSVGSIMLWGDGTATVGYTGGGAAHNNMPPYKNVHIWERTA